MHVPDVLLDIAGGIALTLLISFIFKKILPRLAKKHDQISMIFYYVKLAA